MEMDKDRAVKYSVLVWLAIFVVCTVASFWGQEDNSGIIFGKITFNQVVLTILTLIGVNLALDRFGYLEVIKKTLTEESSNKSKALEDIHKVQGAIDSTQKTCASIADAVFELKEKVRVENGPDKVLLERNDRPDIWKSENINEVWFAAKSFTNYFSTHGDSLIKHLEKDKKIRVLVLNPDADEVLEAYAESSSSNKTLKDVKDTLKRGINSLRELDREYEGFAYKFIKGIPPCGISIVNPNAEDGWGHTEMFVYKKSAGSRPSIRFDQDSSPKTMRAFTEQFNAMWIDGIEP